MRKYKNLTKDELMSLVEIFTTQGKRVVVFKTNPLFYELFILGEVN